MPYTSPAWHRTAIPEDGVSRQQSFVYHPRSAPSRSPEQVSRRRPLSYILWFRAVEWGTGITRPRRSSRMIGISLCNGTYGNRLSVTTVVFGPYFQQFTSPAGHFKETEVAPVAVDESLIVRQVTSWKWKPCKITSDFNPAQVTKRSNAW